MRQYTDALWIFDENSFLALRILEDEIDCGPVWKYDKGSIADAVSALLTLPEPGERLAPSLVLRSSGLWTPG
ncbi:hypothetical protein CLV40_112107 [Actinokineospora auranticolor]|uniref:Uncharacterized protein n=1 Tax=Actinokineospora auranticolor TaxID=155976 RepID=A0A2S6GKW0_9PSEU|nr:hypothetical protein CLV40_112107 [Actinokineospora auranticolor]